MTPVARHSNASFFFFFSKDSHVSRIIFTGLRLYITVSWQILFFFSLLTQLTAHQGNTSMKIFVPSVFFCTVLKMTCCQVHVISLSLNGHKILIQDGSLFFVQGGKRTFRKFNTRMHSRIRVHLTLRTQLNNIPHGHNLMHIKRFLFQCWRWEKHFYFTPPLFISQPPLRIGSRKLATPPPPLAAIDQFRIKGQQQFFFVVARFCGQASD